MTPVRVVHAFRLPIIAATTALALSGCVHTSSPVAMEQPQDDLNSMAYGQAYAPPPRSTMASPPRVADSGGAVGALRASFAAARQPPYAPVPVVYAAAPMPPAHDAVYRLDAGDKLRVVVYGQEGLTNTYAIGASGAITVPLIGSVPARGRLRPNSPPRSAQGCARASSAIPRSRSRLNPTGPSLSLAKLRRPANTLTFPI